MTGSPPSLLVVVVALVGGVISCIGCIYEAFRAVFRKPEVLISRPRRLGTRVGTIRPNDELAWDGFSDADRERRRRVLLYVLNDTDRQQTITIQPGDSDVVWPWYPTRIYVEPRQVTLDPHQGGNMDFLITNPGAGWPDKAEWPDRIYWLRIRGHTQSGRIVRFIGAVRARPLRIANAQGLTDFLFHVTRLGFVRPN
jgi:hypothetical protein